MYAYIKGNKYDVFRTHGDICRFDITDDGATIMVTYRNPKRNEVDAFRAKEPFTIAYIVVDGIIVICVKFGDLQWMDMPYHASMSPNLHTLQEIKEGQGLLLQVFFADSDTGELKITRTIGLETEFSRRLLKDVSKQMDNPISNIEYHSRVSNIQFNFSTLDLLNRTDSDHSYSN